MKKDRFGPRELAHLLLLVCDLGIDRRMRGTCLGPRLSERLLSHGGEVALQPPGHRCARLMQTFLAERHARRGHDAGCEAFGVGLRELREVLRGRDRSGAAGLLMEAVEDAAAELLDAGPREPFDRARLGEAIEHHIARRITPRAKARERAAA